MPSIMEMLSEQLGGENLSMISQQIGADESTTQNALSAALPSLIGALSRNAESEAGIAGPNKSFFVQSSGAGFCGW